MWGVTLIVGAGRRPVEAEGGDMRMDSTADCLCSLGPVRDCRQALDKELREQEFSLVLSLITSVTFCILFCLRVCGGPAWLGGDLAWSCLCGAPARELQLCRPKV